MQACTYEYVDRPVADLNLTTFRTTCNTRRVLARLRPKSVRRAASCKSSFKANNKCDLPGRMIRQYMQGTIFLDRRIRPIIVHPIARSNWKCRSVLSFFLVYVCQSINCLAVPDSLPRDAYVYRIDLLYPLSVRLNHATTAQRIVHARRGQRLFRSKRRRCGRAMGRACGRSARQLGRRLNIITTTSAPTRPSVRPFLGPLLQQLAGQPQAGTSSKCSSSFTCRSWTSSPPPPPPNAASSVGIMV